MNEGNYQEQRHELSSPAPSGAPGVDDGRRLAAALHLVAALTVLMPLVTHHDTTGGVLALVWLAAAILCPLAGAVQTWRTGRVFRYPVWDLLQRSSSLPPRSSGEDLV